MAKAIGQPAILVGPSCEAHGAERYQQDELLQQHSRIEYCPAYSLRKLRSMNAAVYTIVIQRTSSEDSSKSPRARHSAANALTRAQDSE